MLSQPCAPADHIEGVLAEALAPLKALPHKCFACLGNHDIERDDVYSGVREDLSSAGVSLLIDESLIVPTRLGDVQMVGLNWWGNGISSEGKLELEAVQDSMPAYVLLHNPEAISELDQWCGVSTIAFCGHSHGGLLGLVSFGLSCTLLSMIGMIDHGLWGVGRTRAYVHRAQGFRALACNWLPRLGVPPEYSVLEVEWDAPTGTQTPVDPHADSSSETPNTCVDCC